jgi:hypothetical protein
VTQLGSPQFSSPQVTTEISDDLWERIAPPRARGRWWISMSVLIVVVAGFAGWLAGAFHPRVGITPNETTVEAGVVVIRATIDNEGPLPLHLNGVSIDQPGYRLISAHNGDLATARPPVGQRLGRVRLGSQPRSVQVVLVVAIDCAAIRSPLSLHASLSGLLVHRVQTVNLGADLAPHEYCMPPSNS